MSGHIFVEPETEYVEIPVVEIPVVVNELNFIPGESVFIESSGSRIPATIIKETAYYLEYSIESTETPGEKKLYLIKASESPMKFYGLETRLSPVGIRMPTTEKLTRDYVEIPLVKGNFTFIPGETVIMAQNDSRSDIPKYTPVWSLTIASDSADKFEYVANISKPDIKSHKKAERKDLKFYRLKSGLGGGRKKSRRYKTRRYKRSRLSRRKKHH